MKYEEIKTDGYLSNFVKCFWTSETLTKSSEYTILPDGYFDLIVEIRNKKISSVKLTGIWTIPIDIQTETHTEIFAVRFKPLAIELLENINLKSLLNSSIYLGTDFIGIDNLAFNNFKDFCKHIENYLQRRIEKSKTVNDLKIRLFIEIFKKEIFNVQELSERVFWTSRQINRYFNLTFGLSLKEYLNIIRCNQTFKDISKNRLTLQSNYFDQSHFIKEIKKFTGATPTELKKNENDRFLQLSTIKAF
ncbi:MAG: AraC family transcriptional regulator [Bacteroidetes bacterium]|nr:AraC family transcriptional regulator [Bacteroidota bacterium]